MWTAVGRLGLAAAVCALTGTISAAERNGAIVGMIMDEATARPLADARVQLDESGQVATSDGAGRFVLAPVAFGAYHVTVQRDGYLPRKQTDVVVTAGRETELTVALLRSPTRAEQVEVRASSFAQPVDAPASVFSMSYEEIRRAPGAFGGDVGRLIQSLPGLAGRDDLRNDIVARGGSPAENLILVDGVEVPSLSHFGAQGASGGPITMLSAEVVGEARFQAGGFPARFGERLSSVLEIYLREGNRRRRQAEIDVGTSGAGLVAEGPLGRRGAWLLSGRRSYVDLIAGSVDASAIPIYANYQAKLSYDLGARQRLSLISLGGGESLAVDVSQQDADDPNTFNTDQAGWRATTGLTWRTLFGTSGVGTLVASDSLLSNRTDAWDQRLDNRLILHNRSTERESALRYDFTQQSPRLGTLMMGLSAKRLATTLDRTQPLGQEDPYSSDPTRVNVYALDDKYATWQAGGFLQLSRSLGSWQLTLGGRVEHFAADAATRVAPRASVAYQPDPRVQLSLAAGRYYQLPSLVFLRAHPDNAALAPIAADHLVVGLAWTPKSDLRVSIEGYGKRYERYPVSRDFPSISLANLGDAYDTSLFVGPMLSSGSGRASGIEVNVQKKLGRRLYGQASYAYARSQHRAQDGVLRPGRFDLPHVATLVGGIKLSRSIEVSTRASYTSGRPITPYDIALSSAQNREVYDVARINAARAPAYYRLDLRADRRFAFGWGNLVLYLEVDNVTNRENVREYLWNRRENRIDTAPQATRMIIGGLNLEL